jgi:hypothetical protein
MRSEPHHGPVMAPADQIGMRLPSAMTPWQTLPLGFPLHNNISCLDALSLSVYFKDYRENSHSKFQGHGDWYSASRAEPRLERYI